MTDVICLGIMVADVMVRPVDRWPETGSLQFVESLEVHSGGCAVNTGIGLHRLGLDVSVVGQVGQDAFGDFLIGVLHSHRMPTHGVRRVEGGTSGSIAIVSSSGERTFLHHIGANRTEPEDIGSWRIESQARHLHVGGAFLLPGLDGQPMANLLAEARAQGMTTSVDTAFDFSGRWMDLIRPVLPHTDYFLPSYVEAKALSGREDPSEQAEYLLQQGVGTVAIKLGDQGALVAREKTQLRVEPLSVTALDATGAGDAWVAGFLDGVLAGWPLSAAALWGNAQGAASVSAAGATTGVRDRDGLERLLRDQGRWPEFLDSLGQGAEGGCHHG